MTEQQRKADFPEKAVTNSIMISAMEKADSYHEYLQLVEEYANEITTPEHAKRVKWNANLNNIMMAFDEYGTLTQAIYFAQIMNTINKNQAITMANVLEVLGEHLKAYKNRDIPSQNMHNFERSHHITEVLRTAVLQHELLAHLTMPECREIAGARLDLETKEPREIENYALVVAMSNVLFESAKQLIITENYTLEEVFM